MKSLTEKQKQILNYIVAYSKEKKYPPSIREIAEHFKITPKGAYDHLKALEKKGVIKTEKNRSRAIELLLDEQKEEVVKIPLVGRIAAGAPILAEEYVEEYIAFPKSMLPSHNEKEVFALRVRGDSMINANIHDGDIAVILKTSQVKDGDIVVALLGDEATLKYFYKEKDFVRLEPANPKYRPIVTKEVIILGKLIGLYKKFS